MKLSNMDCSAWEELEQKGYATPKYNRQEMIKNTKENPFWIHFGAGNIFRAFPVNVVEQLLNEGKLDRGFIVAEGYDYEIIEKAYQKYDNYSILVTLHGDGTLDKAVLGSVAESLEMNREKEADFERLKAIFKNPSLQIVSFTITEKGYQISDKDGNYFEAIKKDIELGPDKAQSYMGKLAALLVERYENGAVPVALVSMDNCSKNGEKLRNAVTSIAKEWVNHKKVEEGFLAYVENENCVAFPWTMIDKITPRPSEVIEKMLTEDGWEEASATVTGKNTYVAPFVNAEECQYLVIEDSFPNGRPDITGKGIFFTDRETVNRSEQMKVCTCLNPIHTALAIFGCLLEIETMSGAIKNPELKALAEEIGYQEGLKVVKEPGILNPKDFIKEVLEVRIPNPYMPDTPKRIATDTSQKLPIRFGETIKAYEKQGELKAEDLKGIALVYAAWLRYLMGINDNGEKMELSSDPCLEMLTEQLASLEIGKLENAEEILKPILENKHLFGVDLYECNMASLVLEYFKKMASNKNGVKAVLKDFVAELRR